MRLSKKSVLSQLGVTNDFLDSLHFKYRYCLIVNRIYPII